MEDTTEELEPLFDYHRVQPLNTIPIDDDDEEATPLFFKNKKRRVNKTTDNKKVDDYDEEGRTPNVVDLLDEEEEEDWLPPPPKIAAPNREEDSAIKQIRLKRQELTSVVQSGQDALRAADEATKKVVTSCSNSSIEENVEEPVKPAAERAKMVISIQDKAGTKQYLIFADDKFEQFFSKYAEKAKIDIGNLVFKFDGDKIDPASTPKSLGMEDEDIIEVNVKAR